MEQNISRKVLRCPACGTEFTDIAMICPDCGNIFDQTRLSPSLKAFASELDEYDKVIADAPKHFRGKSKTAAAERRKAGLIRDFVFESDGKSILEALLFIKSKVALEARRKAKRKALYWIRLWTRKAEQLYEKVQVLFPGNDRVETAYSYIIETNLRIQKAVRRKAIAGGMAALILTVMAVLYGSIKNGSIGHEDPVQTRPKKTAGFGSGSIDETAENEGSTGTVKRKLIKGEKEENTIKSLQLENFTFSIPDYWVENGSKEEYYQAYAETGRSVAMLSIAYPHDKDEVSLEALYADHENMITAIEAMFGECEVTEYEGFKSDFGVVGIIYYFTCVFDTGSSKQTVSGTYVCFPSVKDNRWFFVILIVSDNIEGDYDEDFMEILASIKEVET